MKICLKWKENSHPCPGSTKNPNQDQPKRFTPNFGKIKKKKKRNLESSRGKTNSYVSISPELTFQQKFCTPEKSGTIFQSDKGKVTAKNIWQGCNSNLKVSPLISW